VLIYKTKDDGAKRLIDIAKSMRRTIVPDGALTRSMAESSKLGQRIDKEFYKAVGRIIAQNNIS
jgi:flagellar biosynthesis protein FlhB